MPFQLYVSWKGRLLTLEIQSGLDAGSALAEVLDAADAALGTAGTSKALRISPERCRHGLSVA